MTFADLQFVCLLSFTDAPEDDLAIWVGVISLHVKHLLLPQPGRVAQSVGHLTHKSGVLGSIPGLATYFRFSFRFFKKGSCQILAKVCARSTG